MGPHQKEYPPPLPLGSESKSLRNSGKWWGMRPKERCLPSLLATLLCGLLSASCHLYLSVLRIIYFAIDKLKVIFMSNARLRRLLLCQLKQLAKNHFSTNNCREKKTLLQLWITFSEIFFAKETPEIFSRLRFVSLEEKY